MSIGTQSTIPAPNANTDELADELESLALTYLDKTTRTPEFWSGWADGVRASAEYVRQRGKQ